MKHLSTALLTLSLAMFGVQPVMASVISDGSAGVFRPTTDFTLDLTGTTLPQFTSIFVDAGIRLTVLTPTNGVFGDLLAANDIFLNGIIDAGSGNLGLYAGNQIVLGTGSQLIAGALNVFGGTLLFQTGATITVIDTSSPSYRLPSGTNQSGGTISIVGSGSIDIYSPPPSASIIRGIQDGGTLSLGGGLGLGGIELRIAPITLTSIPEPSTILLLLPGVMILLMMRKFR